MNKTEIAANVDRLGFLAAQMAPYKDEYKALCDKMKAECGDGEYEGNVFRAAIFTTDRETLDMEAVRAKLSPQFIRANTNVTPVTTCKVSARKGVAAPAPMAPATAEDMVLATVGSLKKDTKVAKAA